MKRKKRVNIRKEGENDCRAAKYKEKVVSGLYIDVSSLPKEIRKEIFKDLFGK